MYIAVLKRQLLGIPKTRRQYEELDFFPCSRWSPDRARVLTTGLQLSEERRMETKRSNAFHGRETMKEQGAVADRLGIETSFAEVFREHKEYKMQKDLL